MLKEYISDSADMTMEIGRAFAADLRCGDVVALSGDLGAGKTVFVKGIAKGLNIGELITSPTFNIVREYEGDLKLYHFDVYRISSDEEMDETGYYDCQRDGVAVIEWAEIIKDILPEKHISVRIEHRGGDSRLIVIERPEGEDI